MEGFIINLIATTGFSMIFIIVFFSIYYLYLKGNEENKGEGKDKSKRGDKDKDKKLGKRVLK